MSKTIIMIRIPKQKPNRLKTVKKKVEESWKEVFEFIIKEGQNQHEYTNKI